MFASQRKSSYVLTDFQMTERGVASKNKLYSHGGFNLNEQSLHIFSLFFSLEKVYGRENREKKLGSAT